MTTATETSLVGRALRAIRLHHLKQAGFVFLIVAAVLTVESKSAFGAYHAQGDDHLSGIQWALLSALFACLGTFGFGLAADLKDDYRPHVQRRALFTRIVSLVFMIAPTCFLGSSIKANNLDQRWNAYIERVDGQPSAFDRDQRVAADMQADRYEREAASARLQRPSTIDLDPADGEFWIAAFFTMVLLFGADAMRVPAPMTKEEFEHLKRSNAAKKGARTRKKNAEIKPRAVRKPRTVRKPKLDVVTGGRK